MSSLADDFDKKFQEAGAKLRAAKANGSFSVRHGYGKDGDQSWFRDIARAKEAQMRARQNLGRPPHPGDVPLGFAETTPPAFGVGRGNDIDDVKERLRAASDESRALGYSTPSAGLEFVPPGWLMEIFGPSATPQGTIPQALTPHQLPDASMVLNAPRVGSGPTATITSGDGVAASDTDATTTSASTPVALFAGDEEMSRQLFDRSVPGFDQVTASELQRKIAASWDTACLYGSGSAGQTKGLASVSGIVAVTFTSGSPTVQTTTSAIWNAYQKLADTATGYGVVDPSEYVVICHPRRYAFLASGAGMTSVPSLPDLPGTVVRSGAVATTGGAGTNQDEIFVLVRSEVFAIAGEVSFDVFLDGAISANAQVRVQVRQYGAILSRNPTAIARLTGTAFTTPVL